MPYGVSKGTHGCGENEYAVYKKDDGKKLGCHESEEAANRQIAAIYANEKRYK